MLGGGTFTVQNKILPGSYINVVSSDMGANVFGERGVVALGMELDWGDKDIIELSREEFIKNSAKYFARAYNDISLTDIREAFKNAEKLLIYKLNQTSHKQADCTYCSAKGFGARGNRLKVIIAQNPDNGELFDVSLALNNEAVFSQTVSKISELDDNDYVTWNDDAGLSLTTGTALTGGASGYTEGIDVQNFFNKLDNYSFNAVAILSEESSYERLLIEYTKRMRDEVGKKFQCVTANSSGDYEGNVYVQSGIYEDDDYHLLAWVAGAVGSCPVNKSLTNMLYNGEYTISATESQAMLEQSIKKGAFVFHKVNNEMRVLLDINSLITTTTEKGEDFKDNQTIRIVDQIAADIAAVFNNYYLGKVPNDAAGRNSLWCDIVKHHEKLLELRAIDDFDENNITVEKGESKKSVVVTDVITPANAMTQLYMTVRIN